MDLPLLRQRRTVNRFLFRIQWSVGSNFVDHNYDHYGYFFKVWWKWKAICHFRSLLVVTESAWDVNGSSTPPQLSCRCVNCIIFPSFKTNFKKCKGNWDLFFLWFWVEGRVNMNSLFVYVWSEIRWWWQYYVIVT